MKRIQHLMTSLFLIGLSHTIYADSANPYTFFSTGSSASPSSNTATTVSNNANGTSNPVAAPVAPAVPTTPQIQYIQPANQVGQVNATTQASPVQAPQPVAFAATNNATTAQGAKQSSLTNAPTNLNNSLQSGLLSAAGADGAGGDIDLGQTNSLLQAIADNTKADQSNTGGFYQYWIKDYSNDVFIPTTSGYGSVANLASQNSTNQSTFKQIQAGDIPDLSADWTQKNDSGSIDLPTAIPYLGDITRGATDNPTVYAYWGPAVNNAIADLAAQQAEIEALHQAALAPFGGQSNWLATVQTASTPQLLRTLVVEQAVQNELLYQSLQRQKDAELMQASQLRMLYEVNNSLTQQNALTKRLITVLQLSNQK